MPSTSREGVGRRAGTACMPDPTTGSRLTRGRITRSQARVDTGMARQARRRSQRPTSTRESEVPGDAWATSTVDGFWQGCHGQGYDLRALHARGWTWPRDCEVPFQPLPDGHQPQGQWGNRVGAEKRRKCCMAHTVKVWPAREGEPSCPSPTPHTLTHTTCIVGGCFRVVTCESQGPRLTSGLMAA